MLALVSSSPHFVLSLTILSESVINHSCPPWGKSTNPTNMTDRYVFFQQSVITHLHSQIIQLPTAPCIHQGRQIAIASSMSSEALAPLPACAPQSLTPPQSRPKVPPMPIKLRLAPTTFDNADAIVFVPPALPHARQPQALLFVGPALQRLRNPPRPLAKGLRLHPYRIVRRIHPSTVRRTPMAPANMNIRD